MTLFPNLDYKISIKNINEKKKVIGNISVCVAATKNPNL